MSYFTKFPRIDYNDSRVVDITRRVLITSETELSTLDYAPYTVADGERPEDIANFYYDDPNLAYLVLLANNIVDPYTDWCKTQYDLEEYIKVQYADQANATGDAVLIWSQNNEIDDNIVYYESQFNSDIRISKRSYDANPNNEFKSVRVYEYESELNQNKRNIVLINRSFLSDIQDRIEKELSDD